MDVGKLSTRVLLVVGNRRKSLRYSKLFQFWITVPHKFECFRAEVGLTTARYNSVELNERILPKVVNLAASE